MGKKLQVSDWQSIHGRRTYEEGWNDGVLEYWSFGVLGRFSNTDRISHPNFPLLHFAITPDFPHLLPAVCCKLPADIRVPRGTKLIYVFSPISRNRSPICCATRGAFPPARLFTIMFMRIWLSIPSHISSAVSSTIEGCNMEGTKVLKGWAWA